VSHINVPLREPLVPDFAKLDFSVGRSKNRFELFKSEGIVSVDASVFKNKNGIIICGGNAYADYHMEVFELGHRLKAPVLADPISNFRNYADDLIIDSYDAFLKNDSVKKELKPEFIIQFGQVPISGALQQFLSIHRDALYYQVDEVFQYRNPSLTTDKFIISPPKCFAMSISIENKDSSYLNKWQNYQQQMRKQLKQAEKEERLFEGGLICKLQKMFPENSRVIVANSMPIRDIDYFFEARKQNVKILGNRGTNGIDGIVSTALGISTSGKPTFLLTGDLAFFHDLNGLLIGKTHKLNLVIVLFNNNCGGIFRYLPQCREKHFEYLFLTPHGINFVGLETLYGIKYFQPSNYNDFERDFREALHLEGIRLIEIKIDLESSKALHDKYTILPN
jgi:2-succinyl-5-enolpyruvyl-6-hydroxy-3-cyclohexene-1-carboxylate synthase